MVQQQFRLDPFKNTLFLFCGKRHDHIKVLYWEGDDFLLLSDNVPTEMVEHLLKDADLVCPMCGDTMKEIG